MNIDNYIVTITKKLLFPKKQKALICEKLKLKITKQMELGHTLEEIQKSMGESNQVAAELTQKYSNAYNTRIAYLRYACMVLAVLPFIYIGKVIVHIFSTPSPGGFPTVSLYFANLFTEASSAIITIMICLLSYLSICLFGYISLYNQSFLQKRTIIIMLICQLFIFIIHQPAILGMAAIPMLFNFYLQPINFAGKMLWGILHPQSIVTILLISFNVFLLIKSKKSICLDK